jgi:glycosyltransferase involved in cell wall biosynthesis
MSEKISIIIPIYNEEKNIQPLCDEIFDVLKKDFSSFQSEIIIVND